MGTELESKFRVHAPFVLPDLTGERTGVAAVEPAGDLELTAAYFDTTDLRLAREGITLRHRVGEGNGDGWHLKLPVTDVAVPDASTGARDEIVRPGDATAVPEEIRDLLTAHLRGESLGEVATLQTSRTVTNLRDTDGALLAELVDDLVSVLSSGHVAGRFREVEVEDRGGGMPVLAAVGEALRVAGAVGGEFVPKVVRALGPQATSPPDPPVPAATDLDAPARELVTSTLRRHVRALMAHDRGVRQGREDSVHQMRVSVRRLRSALRTYRSMLHPEWAEALRSELGWLGDGLAGARDAEVLLELLLHQLDELPDELVLGPVRARIEQSVGGDLVREGEEVMKILRGERYLGLLNRLVAAAWDPPTLEVADVSSRDAVPPVVRSEWSRLQRQVRRLRRPGAADEDWHQARIAAKRTRYAAESAADVFGKRARQFAKRVEQVQDVLGRHQDAVVAAGTLRRLATASRAGASSFTLGLMFAGQQQEARRLKAEFGDVWKRAADPKLRAWLRD